MRVEKIKGILDTYYSGGDSEGGSVRVHEENKLSLGSKYYTSNYYTFTVDVKSEDHLHTLMKCLGFDKKLSTVLEVQK